MQMIVLVVSLVLMGTIGVLFLRAVKESSGPLPDDGVNRRRMRLIWAMTVAGIVVSVVSLREWPHAVAGNSYDVTISSGQWWWEIDKEQVPLGKPVTFHVTSEDVNHGMGIYDEDLQLLFQTQAMPGYVNKISHIFEKAGTYKILCMEFCGVSHHDMAVEFEVVAAESIQ